MWVYLLTGLLAGIAGFLSLAYYGTTTIARHTTDNLNAISGVVLGGTSLFGGVGRPARHRVRHVHPAGAQQRLRRSAACPPFWQPIAVAIVLVAAVWFDQRRRRARPR